MKWHIFVCVLVLVLFSGCLDIITTKQKQLCLSATDFSKTSIYDCNGFSNCFKKINNSGIVVFEDVPFETKNKILTYKNNVSSSVYYFNKAETEIQKIYNFCSGEKDLKIIENINKLTFYISRIFNYQDLSWQKSIEILKDYAIYLKNNGIEEITEEEIYSDFILINENLNELRSEAVESKTYIALLKTEAKNARELASDFGFLKSYMSNINYVDVYAYYSNYIENPEQELKIPVISKSSDYVFSKLSAFENFRKINKSLSRTDNYNLYILFDKHIGTNDSLFTRFVALNNKINSDLNLVFTKINESEKNIESNFEILDNEKIQEYQKYKLEYTKNEIGFGYYLAKLKALEAEMETTGVTFLEKENYQNKQLEECLEIITAANGYNNRFFSDLVSEFKFEENINAKLDICQKLKTAINNENCFLDLEKLITAGVIENTNISAQEECIDLLNQLNYNLKNSEKILLYFEILKEAGNTLKNLKNIDTDLELQIQILEFEEMIEKYKNKKNYEIILEINKYLAELQKINAELNALWNTKLIALLSKNSLIVYDNGFYFLEVFNPGNPEEYICFRPRDINLATLTSNTGNLKIAFAELCVEGLGPGKNRFSVEYKNNRKITTKIITLSTDRSLLETVIKNEVIGIKDSLNLGHAELAVSQNYVLLPTGEISYITQKENKILYYLKILEKTNIENRAEVFEGVITTTKKFKLKNTYSQKACGVLALEACEDCAAKLFINGVTTTIDFYSNFDFISTNLCFEDEEEKVIEINYLQDLETINSIIDDLLVRINKLNNSDFEKISQNSKTAFSEIYSKLIVKDFFEYEDILLALSLEDKIEELEKEQKKYQNAFDNTNLLLSKIIDSNLGNIDPEELENIEKINLTNPLEALKLATELNNRLQNKQEFSVPENIKQKIANLTDMAKMAGLYDDRLQYKFSEISLNENTDINLELIENEITEKIKQKTKEAYDFVIYFKETDVREVYRLLDELTWVYSDIELKELYAVKYYPSISLDDGIRLKKKLSYIDTIGFKEASTGFLTAYNSLDYYSALKKIDITALERLKDLNTEITLVEKGLLNFRNDANTDIAKLLNSKISKNSENKVWIAAIKKDYENKKYLIVIRDSRKLLSNTTKNIKINYQVIVMSGFFLIVGVLAVVFKTKAPKKLSKEEKKQKILRHY